MKLGTALLDGARQVAILKTATGIYDLTRLSASGTEPRQAPLRAIATDRELTMLDLACHQPALVSLHAAVLRSPSSFVDALLPADRLALLAPIPRPSKNIFCVGRNYVEHIDEDNASRNLDTEAPKYPQFFTKPPTAVIGPFADIRLDDRVTRRLDYEVELAVVIGKPGRDIPAARAMEHVFGYTLVNDITARDLQRRHDQWFKGKALDGSCPMGPFIAHATGIEDPHALRLRLLVNGVVRQDASTGDMIFRIPQLIESLSAGMTLEAGDIIATGTPAGAGYAMNPRQYLAPGDTVVCELDSVGSLENTVRAA